MNKFDSIQKIYLVKKYSKIKNQNTYENLSIESMPPAEPEYTSQGSRKEASGGSRSLTQELHCHF